MMKDNCMCTKQHLPFSSFICLLHSRYGQFTMFVMLSNIYFLLVRFLPFIYKITLHNLIYRPFVLLDFENTISSLRIPEISVSLFMILCIQVAILLRQILSKTTDMLYRSILMTDFSKSLIILLRKGGNSVRYCTKFISDKKKLHEI